MNTNVPDHTYDGFQKLNSTLKNRSMASLFHVLAQYFKKGHDPNPWFSGITFFSGLAPWSPQIKKQSLMGFLFFDADFLTFFILADFSSY